MRRDTRYLTTFHAVCTRGGFRRAAAVLHCTQPAVTYQIAQLEREMGAPLFERGGSRPVLTPAGRRLLEFCRRFLPEFESTCTEIATGAASRAEPLRIATVSGFGRYVLFPSLAELADGDRAGCRLDVRFRTAAEVLRLVEHGDVDLGVVYLPKVSNLLAFTPLREEELVLIAAPALARRSGAAELRRLSTYETLPFVAYSEGDYVFGRWFDVNFGAQPASMSVAHEFDELEEVVEMVARGHGMSIVPLDSARAAEERGAVRVVRPEARRRCMNRVFAVTRPGAFLRPELQRVLATLAIDDDTARADAPRAAPTTSSRGRSTSAPRRSDASPAAREAGRARTRR